MEKCEGCKHRNEDVLNACYRCIWSESTHDNFEIEGKSAFQEWYETQPKYPMEIQTDRTLVKILSDKIERFRKEGWNGAVDAVLSKGESGLDEGGIPYIARHVTTKEIEKLKEL